MVYNFFGNDCSTDSSSFFSRSTTVRNNTREREGQLFKGQPKGRRRVCLSYYSKDDVRAPNIKHAERKNNDHRWYIKVCKKMKQVQRKNNMGGVVCVES